MNNQGKDSNSTIENIESSTPKLPRIADKKSSIPTPDMFSKFLILEGWSHWFFRFGFASIFFVTAVSAALDPQSFTGMLKANPVANAIGYHDIMVKIAMVNDLLLTIFIVGGWRKKWTYAWAGTWLLLVAGLKLMNLLF